jgi:hypothetical protein
VPCGGGELKAQISSAVESIANEIGRCFVRSVDCRKAQIRFSTLVVLTNVFMRE